MNNKWITVGAIFGFLGVAIGAFGAHSLKQYLTLETIETYKTGVLYHLIHALVILAIGFYNNKKYFLPALFFTIGIILFSFSLYIYSLTNISSIAIITPFGGVSFLIGWLMIIINSFKKS
jgi:uncharacterized membrane protein YgdD (TMEM256/DUF423 family)